MRRNRGILHVNPPRSQSRPNCLGTKQQNCTICAAKTDRTDRSTIMFGDYNIPLHQLIEQNTKKELTNTIKVSNQVYKTFHSKTLSLSAYRTYTKIDHILDF